MVEKAAVHFRPLDVFVKVDPDEHPQDAQNVHFNVESKDEFDQDKVDGERWVDTRIEVRRENALNGALRCHDMENFPEYPAKEPSDQHENDQNPGRFSHAATLLSL
jgi:hypothetical protein